MRNLRLMLVFGIRPEAIKMVPLIQAFAAEKNVQQFVCVTTQNRQLILLKTYREYAIKTVQQYSHQEQAK